MYAVILTGGKQYKVSEGDTIVVEKLEANVGENVEFEVLMTVDGETVIAGKDVTAKAMAVVLEHGKDKKVIVFKYKAKKNIRKKKGHRQPYTRVKIEKIA